MTNMTLAGVAFAAGFLFFSQAPSFATAQIPAQPSRSALAAQPTGTLTRLVTNGPQASPGDFAGWSARRDVARSAEYDHLLETDLTFRRVRERKECGPIIGDRQLHRRCIGSFAEYEPIQSAALKTRWREYAERVAGR